MTEETRALNEDPNEWPAARASEPKAETEVVRPGVRLAGRYLVGEAIGRGGMATVYHGHDELLDRDVAVKVLGSVAANAIGSRQEFLREARAAAALAHPNIVGVYDAGVHGSDRFIVMEYVAGGSLSDMIQAGAPLPPRQVVQLAGQVADALDYGHRHGIVHCDVKPQNVLIDESGRPKLVDFGISRSIAATSALTDTISGTAGYIAPEQLLGDPIDGRVDIYALGCVVYEMLSGELPFDASNLTALATQRLVRPPIPLQRRNATVPALLAASVMRAIERDPEQRYGSARDFSRALAAGLSAPPNGRAARASFGQTASIPVRPATASTPQRSARERSAPSPGPRLFWPLTLVLLGVLVLAGALAALQFPSLINRSSGAPVAVPKVTDQRIDGATDQLRGAGLAINVDLKDTTAEGICTGRVLGQDPSPATHISRGGTVTLVVSASNQC